MNVRRVFVVNVVIIIAVLALCYFGYSYYYRSTHYISTDNATVQATVVPIEPEYPATLSSWNVSDGTQVSAGQDVGQLSTAAELQQLGPSAKSKAVDNAVKQAAVIASPISGTITQDTVRAGQTVAPGVTLAEVVNTDDPYVAANINESDIRNVQVGDSVDVYVDAYPNLSLQGTVTSIGLAANSYFALIPPTDAASGNYTKVTQTIPINITLNGTAGAKLIPGASVSVRIHRNNN